MYIIFNCRVANTSSGPKLSLKHTHTLYIYICRLFATYAEDTENTNQYTINTYTHIMHIHIHKHTHTYTHTHTHPHPHTHTPTYKCLCVCIHICAHIPIYIHTHTYTKHTYIYMYAYIYHRAQTISDKPMLIYRSKPY
jgi:hypothetical protein